jgi:hypothetical protein
LQLELIDGELWANVWQTECIARINITTGQVSLSHRSTIAMIRSSFVLLVPGIRAEDGCLPPMPAAH